MQILKQVQDDGTPLHTLNSNGFFKKYIESDKTMSTILPQGTALKKALSWISENLKSSREAAIDILINDAVFRFDLNPKESDFLYHFYAELRAEEKNNMKDKIS